MRREFQRVDLGKLLSATSPISAESR